VETIHPACALVAEHIKAQEQCIHTQRQEAHMSNNITGELSTSFLTTLHLLYVVNVYPFADW